MPQVERYGAEAYLYTTQRKGRLLRVFWRVTGGISASSPKGYLIAQGGIAVFFKVSIAGTDTGRIIEQMRKAVQLVGKRGELDCRLDDNSIVTIHADRSVTISYPPLRFQPNGEPERRRILAREVLEAI